MTPEKIVQNEIMSYLSEMSKENPIMYERRQAGGFSYKSGIPDIYMVIKGIHIEVEVKKPGGKLSIMQMKFKQMCEKKSIKWICASSLEDVRVIVKELLS